MLIIHINNVLTCLPNMLTFALKKVMVKNNLLSQLIVEDGKNAKNDYFGKTMTGQFFQVS